MPIVVVCGGCGSKSAAPDRAAGTRGKCPKCGTVIQVPGQPAAAATPQRSAGTSQRPASTPPRPAARPAAVAAPARPPAAVAARPAVMAPVAPVNPFDGGSTDASNPFDAPGELAAEPNPFDVDMVDVAPAAPSYPPAAAAMNYYAPSPIAAGPSGFKKIGITFHYCRKSFYGDVIASDNAIYLVLSKLRNDAAMAAAGVAGGAIGGLIAGAVGAMMTNSVAQNLDRRRIITAGQLPPDVRQHPTWPAKKLKPDVEVVVIPKCEIASPGIIHPKWGNTLKIQIDGNPVMIEYRAFGGGKTKAFLENAGWPLAWGQNVAFANADGTVTQSNFGKKVLFLVAGVVVAFGLAVGAIHFFKLTGPKEEPKAFLSAVADGDIAAIKAHHAAGTDVKERDLGLLSAVEENKPEILNLMLEYGANPNASAGGGETAVYLAAKKGSAHLLKTLIDRGAGISTSTTEGWLPIHIAALNGNTDCVKVLLDRGEKPDVPTKQRGETPLMLAAKMQGADCLPVAKLLLSRGAQKTTKDNNGVMAWGYYMGLVQHRQRTPQDNEMEMLLDTYQPRK